MIDYEKLYYLRRHTFMNPVDFVRLKMMHYDANRTQQIINKYENCQVGVDDSQADEFEFNSRFKTWMYMLEDLWKFKGEGLDLFDFACKALDDSISAEKEGNYERNFRQRIK